MYFYIEDRRLDGLNSEKKKEKEGKEEEQYGKG